MRAILEFSAESAEIADWLAERGGFEPPVSREVFPRGTPREYWENFAAKFASIVQRTDSPSVWSGGGR